MVNKFVDVTIFIRNCIKAGSNWNEYRENIDLKFAHSNPTANIVMTASLNEAATNVYYSS